ncbi:MAG: hypothetical protein LQ350_000609 [Teloschistes chrysophthalmus]|nr:MAG: hypothetical protein LQ350_000609 [Niorma chrysophthalma]
MLGDFDPNRLTMQQICAKTQYHGGPPGQHIGGYCHVQEKRVVFDISNNAQISSVLSNPRTMLGWGWTGDPWTHRSNHGPLMYQMTVDRVDDYTTSQASHPGLYGATEVDTVRLYRTGGFSYYAGFPPLWISQDKQNNIEAANVGGYCHRSAGSGPMIREVWFSDEITPRYEWTWNNFIASLGIRFYCYQRCACTFQPSPTDNTAAFWMKPQVKIWRFLHGYEARQNADGSLTYEKVGASSSSGQVLPAPSQGGTHCAGPCGMDGRAFCSSPWPTALLGPIQQMQEPPDPIIEAVKPRPGSHELTTCGSFCKSVLDCGRKDTEAAASDTDCTCATPSPAQWRYLGFDAVVPAAVCLALMATTTISEPLHRRDFVRDGGRLRYVDEKGVEMGLCREERAWCKVRLGQDVQLKLKPHTFRMDDLAIILLSRVASATKRIIRIENDIPANISVDNSTKRHPRYLTSVTSIQLMLIHDYGSYSNRFTRLVTQRLFPEWVWHLIGYRPVDFCCQNFIKWLAARFIGAEYLFATGSTNGPSQRLKISPE